jgi:hypothetical protein
MNLKTFFKKLDPVPQSRAWDLGRGIVFAAAVGVVAGLGAIASSFARGCCCLCLRWGG